jgi:hypothetical protein
MDLLDHARACGFELYLKSAFGHLETVFGFIGLTDLRFIRVGYEEYQDDRLKRSLAGAEAELDELAAGRFGERAQPRTAVV